MTTDNKHTPKLKIYSVCNIGYVGAKPSATFTFEAKDEEDAIDKAKDWCLYHSFQYGRDAIVREANGMELNWKLHNEYVN